VQPNSASTPSPADALVALANGDWINRPSRPVVRINLQPSLFESTLRERFVVQHPTGIPFWPSDSRFSLDFVTDDPISVPFLKRIGVEWCAPCHALISHEDKVVATLTGVLTFASWTEIDQHTGFFELDDLDSKPCLVALASTPRIDSTDRQRALEWALELVYGIECEDPENLLDELERVDDWGNI